MINTSEIATFVPATTSTIVTAAGKITGVRHFLGAKSASEIKEAGKVLGLAGSALKNFVAKALSDEATNRTVSALSFVTHAQANGFVADVAEIRRNTAVLKFVQADTTEAKAKKVAEELAAEKARVAEMAAQIADMQRMLEEMRANDREGNRQAKSK